MEATFSFIPDDGGYKAAEVLEADQPSVVRAIAICLRPNEGYQAIHHRYVTHLAGAGFTPTGKVRASVERHADIRQYPAIEKHAKAQVCEELLASYGFLRQLLPDKKPTLGEAHQQFGNCIALLRDRRGHDTFVALVGGALRDPLDLRTYRWARQAARGSDGKHGTVGLCKCGTRGSGATARRGPIQGSLVVAFWMLTPDGDRVWVVPARP